MSHSWRIILLHVSFFLTFSLVQPEPHVARSILFFGTGRRGNRLERSGAESTGAHTITRAAIIGFFPGISYEAAQVVPFIYATRLCSRVVYPSWGFFFLVTFSIVTFTSQLKTYANGNAKSQSFLSKMLLSKNSPKYPRTAAVGKKGQNVPVFLLFFLTAAGGANLFFLVANCQKLIKSCDDRRSISTLTQPTANPLGDGQGHQRE